LTIRYEGHRFVVDVNGSYSLSDLLPMKVEGTGSDVDKLASLIELVRFGGPHSCANAIPSAPRATGCTNFDLNTIDSRPTLNLFGRDTRYEVNTDLEESIYVNGLRKKCFRKGLEADVVAEELIEDAAEDDWFQTRFNLYLGGLPEMSYTWKCLVMLSVDTLREWMSDRLLHPVDPLLETSSRI
jgi:hypothetical protein